MVTEEKQKTWTEFGNYMEESARNNQKSYTEL